MQAAYFLETLKNIRKIFSSLSFGKQLFFIKFITINKE